MKQAVVSAVIAVGVCFSAGAFAQMRDPGTSGAYAGASIGQSKFRAGCQAAFTSCDDKDTAWRLFGGYQLNRNLGAELGYADFGKAEGSSALGRSSVDANAWDLVGIGSLPIIDRLSAYGKLGVYHGTLKAGGTDHSNNDLTFGLGAQYDLLRNVGLRTEWQRYKDMGGGDFGKTDVDVLNVGVLYRFQ
jgi:OOP family OmpA-OmpF porin